MKLMFYLSYKLGGNQCKIFNKYSLHHTRIHDENKNTIKLNTPTTFPMIVIFYR